MIDDEKDHTGRELFDHLLCDFLNVGSAVVFLGKKERIALLYAICHDFEKLYFENKKILKVKIHSARSLEEEQIESICRRLKERYQKEIRWETQLEPALIGGFKIETNDLIHDLSIQNQLVKFKNRILRG